MSKRAEEAAKEIYKDGIQLFGRRDKNGNLIIHPETMVGILRNACRQGYEQAEKDTIERAIEWLFSNVHDYLYCCVELKAAGIDQDFFADFKEAMEEE